MSYVELKRAAYEANMELNARGLVLYTWGNVSQAERERGVLAIKPSGVDFDIWPPVLEYAGLTRYWG